MKHDRTLPAFRAVLLSVVKAPESVSGERALLPSTAMLGLGVCLSVVSAGLSHSSVRRIGRRLEDNKSLLANPPREDGA